VSVGDAPDAAPAALRDALDESAHELYEHAPCGYLSTLPDGTIVRVNQTFLDWTGYARDALLGRRLQTLLAVPSRIYYETHFAPLLRMQGSVTGVALDLLRASGAALPALVNSVQRTDAAGKPLLVRTTIFDATDRRTYERELLEARRVAERLAAVVRLSGDAILTMSPDGVVQTWNDGAERIFGYGASEAVGRPVLELIVPAERRDEFAEAWSMLRAGREVRLETVRLAKEGRRIDVSLSLTPHMEAVTGLSAVSSIIRDVTERKRLAERLRLAEQLQAVGTLAGGVAHEVNNQMTAVLGFGELVLRALAPGNPMREDVQRMVDAATRSARITQQLLAFSRRQPLAPRALDVHEIVSALAPVLIGRLGADKSLTVAPPVGRTRVRADPTQLEQVVINLVANAADALDTNGRVIVGVDELTLGADDVEVVGGDRIVSGPYVRLRVADTGHGMDAATLRRIFDPFFTTKPVGQGTGLGLPTVYGIVRQHGGYVAVTSAPDRGTTIQVYLPAAAAAEDEAGPAAAKGAVPPVARAALVLVVEDDAVLRGLARRVLEAAGLSVEEADNGRDALVHLDSLATGPDLIVSDIIMPEMNGHQLAAAVAARWPTLPILFTSAYSDDEMRARGMLPEGAPFLQKPFRPDELVARAAELLGRRPRPA
jgi:PAS domain S-box-containing protein